MARSKPASKALTMLQGAVSRSRAKARGNSDESEFLTQALPPEVDTLDPNNEQAYEFAKLLRAGVPQLDALCYVLGSVDPHVVELALPRWMRAKRVVDALATLNGGRWPALEPDTRLDIALDKHYAELAHFLYTHDYESAEGKDLRKLEQARESLERLRVGRMQENSPFVKFLREVLKVQAPTTPLALGEGDVPGQGRGEATRPQTLGLVEVVEAEVTETGDGE